MNFDLTTIINGKLIPRTQVLEWERRRAQIVLKKLGAEPAGEDLVVMRQQLAERKQALGAEAMLKMLHVELVIADAMAVGIARLSLGARRFCETELVTSKGSAEQFVAWFTERARINDESAFLAGTPDHYVIRTASDGSQDVVEQTGGSPMVTRFSIDYEDLSSLRSPADPGYLLQIAGVARSTNGVAIGGVRHQFRNEGNGFRAKLLVEFPLLILPQTLSGHQWHLASEFGNWIEAAFQ